MKIWSVTIASRSNSRIVAGRECKGTRHGIPSSMVPMVGGSLESPYFGENARERWHQQMRGRKITKLTNMFRIFRAEESPQKVIDQKY
jgi:hypothetical protein